jgi:hypothetical protein
MLTVSPSTPLPSGLSLRVEDRTSGSTLLTMSKVYNLPPGEGMRPALCGRSLGARDFAPLSGAATKTEILTHPRWGEGTTTSSTNRHPIPFTIKVRVILVFGGWFDRLTIKRRVNGCNGLSGYIGRKF